MSRTCVSRTRGRSVLRLPAIGQEARDDGVHRLDLVRHEGCDVNERRNVGSAFDASFNIEIFSVPESGNPTSLRHS